jgi:endonuclease III-like uncharacterized protein
MVSSKNLIYKFQYAERIKAEVSIAHQLFEQLIGLKDDEFNGGKKIIEAYINAILTDIQIARNVVGSKVIFSKTSRKLTESIGRIDLKEYEEVRQCFSEALSEITTYCAESLESLRKMDLM